MHVWHLEIDTPRRPERATAGEPVVVHVGTWPIELGQTVWATGEVRRRAGRRTQDTRKGRWVRNEGPNSYWEIDLGRFERGADVRYKVVAEDGAGNVVATREFVFSIEPSAVLAPPVMVSRGERVRKRPFINESSRPRPRRARGSVA